MISSVAVMLMGATLVPAAPAEGAKVRVTLESGRRITSRVVAVDAERLTLRPWTRLPERSLDVPWSQVVRVERSLGASRGKAAAKGALAGGAVALGLLILAARSEGGDPDGLCAGSGCDVLALAVPTAGAAVGAALGAASVRERWERVDTGPAGSSPRLSVSIGFRP